MHWVKTCETTECRFNTFFNVKNFVTEKCTETVSVKYYRIICMQWPNYGKAKCQGPVGANCGPQPGT
jgi:hypothetical protein